MGGPAAHDTEIADIGTQRRDDGWHVELRVVREHTHGVGRAEAVTDALQQAIRPVDDDLVGQREPGTRGEHLAGVTDRHPIAESFRRPAQRGGEVDRTEDQHLRRLGVRLDEDLQSLVVGLTLRAVVADPGASGGELARHVPGHDTIQIGITQRPARRTVGLDEELGAEVRTVDDRGQRHRPSVPQRLAQRIEQHAAYQSTGSTKRCTVPPQVNPTANASSSL